MPELETFVFPRPVRAGLGYTRIQKPVLSRESTENVRPKPEPTNVDAKKMKTRVAIRDKSPHRFQVVPLKEVKKQPSAISAVHTTHVHGTQSKLKSIKNNTVGGVTAAKTTSSRDSSPRRSEYATATAPLAVKSRKIDTPRPENRLASNLPTKSIVPSARNVLGPHVKGPKVSSSRSAPSVRGIPIPRFRSSSRAASVCVTPAGQKKKLHARSPSAGVLDISRNSIHYRAPTPGAKRTNQTLLIDSDNTLVNEYISMPKKYATIQSFSVPLPSPRNSLPVQTPSKPLVHSRVLSMDYDPAKRHAIYSTDMKLALPPSPAEDRSLSVLLERRAAMRRKEHFAESVSTKALFPDDESTRVAGQDTSMLDPENFSQILTDMSNINLDVSPFTDNTDVLSSSHSLPTVSSPKNMPIHADELGSPFSTRKRSFATSPTRNYIPAMTVQAPTPGPSSSFPSLYSQDSFTATFGSQIRRPYEASFLAPSSLPHPQDDDKNGSDLVGSSSMPSLSGCSDVFALTEKEEECGISITTTHNIVHHPIILQLLAEVDRAIGEWGAFDVNAFY